MQGAPRSEQFDDVYFSADDGPGETQHVFLDGNNLPAAWQGTDRFVIAETGFGTGLNFLLAWEMFEKTAAPGAFLDFISVEKFPLTTGQIAEALAPWKDRLSPYLEKLCCRYPFLVPGFHRIVFDNRVALTLIFGDANDVFPELEACVDAWFLDGFTPAKNPDMWTQGLFDQMGRLSHSGTSFATFTSAGFVKRGLQQAGFDVYKQKGFGRKRDMLTGRFAGERPRASYKKGPVAIQGAGLAGAACAFILKQYGFEPVLCDPNGIATGASGNPLGLINPRFTAFRTAESDFYTAAFAQTVRTFSGLENIDYKACGTLHLIADEDKEKRFTRTAEHWGWHRDHMRLVDAAEASVVSGISIDKPALYLPQSARISPAALCGHYAQSIAVTSQMPSDMPIIYAGGPHLASAPDFSWLGLQTVRGQITTSRPVTPIDLKTNICYSGYISASLSDGQHIVGSTFQKWLTDTHPNPEDDAYNLAKLKLAIPSLPSFETTGHRAALRTAAPDRFPVIGPVPGQSDAWMTTAHGSHGIASSLAGAHLLADYMRGGPYSLGKSTINALSGERFLIRQSRKAL